MVICSFCKKLLDRPETVEREGALDVVAQTLTQRDAGAYVVDYTHAGGQQRVAMMWDTDVLKARTEVEQLLPLGDTQAIKWKGCVCDTHSALWLF